MSSDASASASATSAMANMSVKEIKEHAIVARQLANSSKQRAAAVSSQRQARHPVRRHLSTVDRCATMRRIGDELQM